MSRFKYIFQLDIHRIKQDVNLEKELNLPFWLGMPIQVFVFFFVINIELTSHTK